MGVEFKNLIAEGKKEYLWASALEWGTKSFICRPRVDLWAGVRVLQVRETSTSPSMTFYIMVALMTVRGVFSVSNFNLATSAEALLKAL